MRSDIRFPRRQIGIHVALPVWEPQRKILGGGDSGRWLSSLWVRTESAPWRSAQGTQHCWRCCALGESLKPCPSSRVVIADPRTLCASIQAFSLLSLPRLSLCNSAQKNPHSSCISYYAFFSSHSYPAFCLLRDCNVVSQYSDFTGTDAVTNA